MVMSAGFNPHFADQNNNRFKPDLALSFSFLNKFYFVKKEGCFN